LFTTPFSQDNIILTTIDHPNITSLELFTNNKKCNLRCFKCHNISNPEPKNYLTKEELENEVINAQKMGAKLCIICGGEPTFFTDEIIECLPIIKKYLKVRIDSNGQQPNKIKQLKPFVDGFALDIKIPIKHYYNGEKPRYAKILGIKQKNINNYVLNLLESISLVDKMNYTLYRSVLYPQFTTKDIVDISDFMNAFENTHYFNKFMDLN
jgi:pyruvate-formate lyase-activating enzyme